MDTKFNLLQLDTSSALPLANQLARRLTWMVAGGMIAEGETLPNIRDMGEFLGVHMHTVRAAYHLLEESGIVTIKPRAGTVVQKYTPFVSQKQISLAQGGQIAVLIPEMNAFYNHIFLGIRSVADPDHYLPLAIPCGEDPHRAEAIYSDISAGNFTGVINISLGFSDQFYRDFSGKEFLSVPLVFVDDFNACTHRILIDTSEAISQGTAHLIQHGYTDIALLNCSLDWPVGIEVYRGFTAALAAHSLQIPQDRVFTAPDFSFEAGLFCTEQMLARNDFPRALIAASDSLALAAIAAFKKHGLSVPQDIAVIGYNDIPASSFVNPLLTTIALPAFDIGVQAMHSLQNVIDKKVSAWEFHQFKGNLLVRQSCGCT